jgi:hypothetical protein
MAVDEEVGAQVIGFGVLRTGLRRLCLLDLGRQQKNGRRCGLCDERLGWAQAAHVDRLSAKLPALRVRMEVVPDGAKVEVEHVPADLLASHRLDGGCIADEGATIQAEARDSGAILSDAVSFHAGVDPLDSAAWAHRCGVGVGGGVDKLHGWSDEVKAGRIGTADGDSNRACHHCVEVAVEVKCGGRAERHNEGRIAWVERVLVERRLPAKAGHEVEEQRHV